MVRGEGGWGLLRSSITNKFYLRCNDGQRGVLRQNLAKAIIGDMEIWLEIDNEIFGLYIWSEFIMSNCLSRTKPKNSAHVN